MACFLCHILLSQHYYRPEFTIDHLFAKKVLIKFVMWNSSFLIISLICYNRSLITIKDRKYRGTNTRAPSKVGKVDRIRTICSQSGLLYYNRNVRSLEELDTSTPCPSCSKHR